MASYIEETPFSLNFQADSLRSGSISFGRYENEALCWERRSSFSHNRYLEEVEKYSRPGSVTEKKAYFEAHFRKRALMKQTSSGSQNGTEYQSSENDTLENVNYQYDFGSFREGSYSARFDESPVGSISEKDFEEAECAREHTGTSYSDPQHELSCISANVEDSIPDSEQVNSQETISAEVDNPPLINNEPEIGVLENLSAEAGTSDMTSKAVELSASGQQAEADSSVSLEHQEGPSDEVKTVSQPKQMKSKIKSQVTGAQSKRNTSSRASKDLVSKPIRRETVPLRSKSEKKVFGTPSPATRTSHRMHKHEVPHYSKTKAHFLNKSADIESRTRVKDSLRSASEKVVPKANLSANWSKQGVSSTKPGIKQNGPAFSFKSNERVEKRKEIYTKLDEKMHAKEAEMHQLRAKTQEKSESKIKHLRRSLNFKPTTMPSFSHEARRDSEKSKGTSGDRKSSKPRSKSSSSGIETSERSPSLSKAGNDKAPAASEPLNKSDAPHDTEATSFPRTSPSKSRAPSAAPGASRPAQAGSMNLMNRKKEQHKEMHTNLQKHKVSEGSKVIKGQKIEGKSKMSTGRSNTSGMRKDMKGVHLGSSSRMGHLAVGVAS